jgi:hypothetical protein
VNCRGFWQSSKFYSTLHLPQARGLKQKVKNVRLSLKRLAEKAFKAFRQNDEEPSVGIVTTADGGNKWQQN